MQATSRVKISKGVLPQEDIRNTVIQYYTIYLQELEWIPIVNILEKSHWASGRWDKKRSHFQIYLRAFLNKARPQSKLVN